MFGLGRRNDGVLYGVLIDVGSGSVGIAVVESDAVKKQPEVLFSHRVFMRMSKHTADTDDRIRRIREALFSASLILSKEGIKVVRARNRHALPKYILVTCSSPWSQISTRDIHYTQNTPVAVTPELLKDLLASAESNTTGNQPSAGTKVVSSDLVVVERATVDVRINDYVVRQPIGLKGTEIALSHITGLVPKVILDSVNEVRDKLFPRCPVYTHTTLLASFTVLRDHMPELPSFGIIDVSGEATEIGLVTGGVLTAATFAPYGSDTLIRSIMETTGKTGGDAMSLLTAYAEKRLSESSHAEVEGFLSEYRAALSSALANLKSTAVFPESVFVTAYQPLGEFFKQTIVTTLKSTAPKTLDVVSVADGILEEGSAAGVRDVYLALSSEFFHKIHRCGELD